MKHKMDTGFAKFLKDESKKLAGIEVLLYDDEEIQIRIPCSESPKKCGYLVSCSEGYWRCDCKDYAIQQGRTEENVGIGSYCCKHIEEAHYKIAKLKGIYEQSTLASAFINKQIPDESMLIVPGLPPFYTGETVIIAGEQFKIRDAMVMENNQTMVRIDITKMGGTNGNGENATGTE